MDEQIELEDQGDNVIRTQDISLDINPNGLGHELFWSMRKYKNALAQIEAATGEQDTYDTLLTKCIRTAIQMKLKGVKPNDVIMPCTTNHINTSVPFFAGFFIGARVASLDPSLSLSDMKYLIKLMKPKLIFASLNAVDSLEESLGEDISEKPEIVVFGSTEKHTDFNDFLKQSEQEESFLPEEVDTIHDTALTMFTSGSTGLSKGICLSHHCILARMGYCVTSLFAPKIMIIYSPLYWLSAACTRFMCVISGATLLIASNFTPEKTFDYLEKYKVTHTFFSPAESVSLLKHNQINGGGASFPKMEFVLISGGFLSAENISELRKMFINATVFFSFGQTEIFGVVLGLPKDTNGRELFLKKGNTVGQPAKGNWYKIVNPETEEVLGPNQSGELRLKTKYVMNGYHDLDSSSAWDSDGWFKTGDICYYDEDHFFYVVDRLKELIKFRGWHIAPAFLENILLQHPAVKTAVVIGVPHEDDVEHALGLVELHEDYKGTTSEELVKHVSEKTGDDKKILHGGIRFITNIPYTPTGKIKRNELRNKILEEIAQKS